MKELDMTDFPPPADDECDCDDCRYEREARFLIFNAVEIGGIYTVHLTSSQHEALERMLNR